MPGPYTLTGTGIQSLGVCQSIHVHINSFPPGWSGGVANPQNWYHVAELRFGTAVGYLPVVHVDATDQVVPVPNDVVNLGYAIPTGGSITVTELSGITVPTPVLPSSDAIAALFAPDIVSTLSLNSVGVEAGVLSVGGATVAWPAANTSIFIPFRLTTTFTPARLWVLVATPTTSNFDIGIYTRTLVLIDHITSTASSGSQTINAGNWPGASLSAGVYYMALAANSTNFSVNARNVNSAGYMRALGLIQANSNFPLASGPTLLNPPTFAQLPIFGLTQLNASP